MTTESPESTATPTPSLQRAPVERAPRRQRSEDTETEHGSQGESIDYLVYEAVGPKAKAPETLVFAGRVRAKNGADARWKAADTRESLKPRTRADGEGDPPLLLAIAARHCKPVPTREQRVVEVKRT